MATSITVSKYDGSRTNCRIVGDEQKFQTTHPCEDGVSREVAGAWELFTVLDGHDGPNAVTYFQEHLLESLSKTINNAPGQAITVELIKDVFCNADQDFFHSREEDIVKRGELVSKLQKLNSFEAYLQYPLEVQQLQEIDQRISGGTTAAVVMINKYANTLWAANVGDSQVLLFSKQDGCKQLTVDHTTSNEDELQRLQGLGLDMKALAENGRLGSCENTRSLGDFCLKHGYKEVDSLQQATDQPGIAIPYVEGPITFKNDDLVVLMTDGVYNTAKHVLEGEYPANLMELIAREGYKAQSVVDTIGKEACKVYKDNVGKQNEDSLRKVALTRKQDDMTLTIIKICLETLL